MVTASVGTYYTDTAATAGAIRWVKASGTGTTGWRVSDGDTGWRDITGLLTVPPTAGSLCVRRIGDHVTWQARGLESPAGDIMGAPPAGFAPDAFQMIFLWSFGVGETPGRLIFDATRVQMAETVPAWRSKGEVTFPVSSAWPSTLPGVPV